MRILFTVLLLVYSIAAYKPPTIDVEEHQVQEHASIGRFVELNENEKLVLKCAGRFDDLKFTFPNMNDYAGYDNTNFEERVEEFIDDIGDTVLTINDVRESDTGTYSCISEEHSSLNDTLHVFVHGSKIFVPLNTVMFVFNEGEVMVPCKTTKFIEKSDLELYANEVLIKSASKNYDQRYGYKITKKLYDVKPIQGVQFECRHKKAPEEEVGYVISEKVNHSDSDNDYQFSWDRGFEWPHVGYNWSLNCHLTFNGPPNDFRPYTNNLHIECDQCSNSQGSHAYAHRHRLSASNRISATVSIEHLELSDNGTYKCIWKQEDKPDKHIEYQLEVAPNKAQIKIVETSANTVKFKEGHSNALYAKFAIYPADGENYTAKWTRVYNSSIKDGPQSETIINDHLRTITSKKYEHGVFSETLDITEVAATVNMSGTYILSISHLDAVHVVQWEVAFENDKPDVQITIREPSSFIVFNQQFYTPDTHLHIDCISISIPPADVVFEKKSKKDEEFQAIDSSKLVISDGTFERGLIWNMILEENVELKCSSERDGKVESTVKSIIVADEAMTVFSDIEKSNKKTSSESLTVIYEGDHVKLTCVVPKDAEDWEISWRFEDENLSDITTTPFSTETEEKGRSKHIVLHLNDITTSSSGKYACVVKKDGSEKLLETIVHVQSTSMPYHTNADSRSSISVDYDHTFVLDCNMDGNPTPDYQWFKDGNEYTHGDQDGSLLRVTRARAEDDGKFHCLATNRAGSTSNFIEVQVNGAPKGSSFLFWLFTFIFIVMIVCVAFLVHKLRVSKRLTKQKDIALSELYRTLIQEKSGPLPEEMKELPIEERTYYLPYNTDYEINPANLEILESLGSGHFGVVRKGLLQMADPKSQIEYKYRLPVAVKSSTNPYNVELQRMMAEELKVMCAIPKHPNVLALIGAVTANMRKGQLYIVTEYIDGGSLKEFLQKHRNVFKNELVVEEDEPVDDSYMVPNSVKKKKYKFEENPEESDRLLSVGSNSLCTSDLLSIGLQIANGMEWLANVPCVHRDLACRNVLITKTKIIRIADFGLAKRHANKTYYRTKKSKETPLPVRWMPIESIESLKFTQKSDVWSFGICLYEIFTLGGTPYPNIDNYSVLDYIKGGQRNAQPEYCHDDIFALMKMCWQASPKDRPTFSECIQFFKEHMKSSSSELLERIDNMLQQESKNQLELEEYTQKTRPDIPGATFKKSPKKPADTRYLIVESHA